MIFNLFDLSVPRFQRALSVLLGLLEKAEARCEAAGPGEQLSGLTELRLAPDMNPLPFQIQAAINNALGTTRRLRGLPPDDLAGRFRSWAPWLQRTSTALANARSSCPAPRGTVTFRSRIVH
ncbi:DUF1993 family protein [Phenylobacterium sp.]|jgi:hypothetical protein|uniref:DUF1993 family protein n=1 Tax=Phenylobacterium sp. TaxID=1871053 RepID=UPI0037CB05F9